MTEINDDDVAKFFDNAPVGGGFPERSIADDIDYQIGTIGSTVHPMQLQGLEVPPRLWAVDGWVPKHSVTGLYGDGGVGKSLLAMMLMTCISKGFSFLGLPVTQEKTFGFFCEDTADELHRRQNDINESMGCQFTDLENMAWQSRVGCDNILMRFANGIGVHTDAYTLMKEEIKDLGAKFVIVDTAADTFGGNENARPEVRQYINLLGQLALEIDGTVVLCAHPSRSGLADESGSGGSTAWNNTLRSRLYLRRPKVKDGDEENVQNTAVRELQKMKGNYSSIGDKLTIKWHHGAFELTDDVSSQTSAENRLGGVQKTIVDALDIFQEFPIHIERLIDAVLPRIPQDPQKKDERRKRFFQSVNSLQSKGYFIISNDMIYRN